jgi:hypothetical protein
MLDGRSTPLTTRACADYLGFTPEWVRQAIDVGIVVGDGRRVKLEAETVAIGSRRTYRIHGDHWIAFLQALGWKRLPVLPLDAAAHN